MSSIERLSDLDQARRSNGPPGFALTEDGIARAFAERHAADLRYCHHTGAWFQWDGMRWRREETQLAFHWARLLCRELNEKDSTSLAKMATAAAVERGARADRAFAVTAEVWDADPWLLGTPGGTVDLRTGDLRPASREDYISKLTGVAPPPRGTPHPLWSRFLDEATDGDEELQLFLRQVAGYCLTGDVSEECVLFVYGSGGNGKGVFVGSIGAILGDYAVVADMATFTASKHGRHPTELAKLKGARLVTASETEAGGAWAESRIKELTGNERPISARYMKQDFFEYWPTFKLLFVGNHKPALRNVDDAVRRRFNIIPFVHKPQTPDPTLKERLREEYPAILRWMIDGCLDWQAHRLMRPPIVIDATQSYFEDQDLFTQWLADCCEQGATKADTIAALFASWKHWAEAAGEHAGSTKSFGQNMVKGGFTPLKNTPGFHGKRGFQGVSVIRDAAEGFGR